MFAVLVDPDKVNNEDQLVSIIDALRKANPDIIMVGGSLISNGHFEFVTQALAKSDISPTIIFPGNYSQISSSASAILLLSLISGRNPDFLIGQHVLSAFDIKRSGLEVISTSYLLIDCGAPTSAQYMSNTSPIPYGKSSIACATALAGEQIGHKMIYMDGGSGAEKAISTDMIKAVRNTIDTPIIVGGGLRTKQAVMDAWSHGADMVVVGTAIEENPDFAIELAEIRESICS